MRPVDPISHAEAARILGCSVRTLASYVWDGRLTSHDTHPTLSRADVDALACQVYRWRRTRKPEDTSSYWVTATRAAKLLGISRSQLDRLATSDRLPHVTHADGIRLYRRDQLETIGNAR